MLAKNLIRIQDDVRRAILHQKPTLPGLPTDVSDVAAATSARHKQAKLLPCSCSAGDYKAHKMPASNVKAGKTSAYHRAKKYCDECLETQAPHQDVMKCTQHTNPRKEPGKPAPSWPMNYNAIL